MATNTINKDITHLGKLSFKELQLLNKLNYNDENWINAQQALKPYLETVFTPGVTLPTYYKSGLKDLGESAFDEDMYTLGDLENNNFGDIRSSNLPALLQLTNGIGKMAVLAGTTFLDGIGGLITGIGLGILNLADDDEKTGFWLGLWDNPFSRAMLDLLNLAEQYMPNYRTRAEQNRPWWENLGTANFWADTVIKNLGFAIGAASGAGIISKGITLGGKLGKWIAAVTRSSRAEGLTNAVVGNSLMALNEGRVEALHNSTEWAKTFTLELESKRDMLLMLAELLYGKDSDEYRKIKALVLEEHVKAMESLEENRIQMGNATMGLNVPVLMLNNMFMYSKLFSGGANTMRKSIQGRIKVSHGADDAVSAAKKNLDNLGENATRAERRAAKQAVKDAERTAKGSSGSILDVEGHIGLYIHNPRGKMYGIGKWLSHGASEGAEELAQRMISEGTGLYHGFDVMESYKAGKDPKYKKQAADLWKATVAGWDKSFGDSQAYEEFFVGAITGLLGIPLFRSRTYRELQVNPQTGELEMVEKKRSPIYLAGGLQEVMQDLKVQNLREADIVKYLKDRILDPKFLTQLENLAANLLSEQSLEEAIKKNDLFSFKNKEFQLLVRDIAMFSLAGRLQDYKDLINHLLDPSEANIKSIVELTSSIFEGSEMDEIIGEFSGQAEIINTEDLQQDNSNSSSASTNPQKTKKVQFVDTPENVEAVLNKLKRKRDKLIELADLIENTRKDIDNKTGGRFTSEELSLLTTLRATSLNHQERARTLIRENRNTLAQILNNLSPNDRDKLVSLIHNTSGFTLSNETLSRIDPRLKREEIKNEKDDLLSLLSNPKINLSDKQIDSILGLFMNNSAFTDYFGLAIVNLLIQSIEEINTVNSLIKSLDDALANKDWSNKYNLALSNFLNKPDKLQEAMDKADKELYDLYMQGRVDEYYEAISQAKDIHHLRDIKSKFSESATLVGKTYEKAKKEGNDRLVKLIEDEDELTAFAKSFAKNFSVQAGTLTADEKSLIEDLIDYISNQASTAQEVRDVLDSIEKSGEYTILRDTVDPDTMEPDVEEEKHEVSENIQKQIAKLNKELKRTKKFSSTEGQESRDITEEEIDEDDLDKYDSNDGIDENPEKKKRKNERSDDKPLGDPKEGLSSAISHLTDQIKDGILNKILNGELDQTLKNNGWTEDQIEEIKKEALHYKDLLDSKIKNGNLRNSSEHIKSSDDIMTSSTLETSEYNLGALLNPDTRTLIENKNDKVTSLRLLGVFEFINKGYLGKLLRGISYKSNGLPIHYIKGILGENGALADEILLAVEVNDLFRHLKIKPVHTVEIGGKKYQIVGVLSPSATEESKQSYENVKNLVEQEYENLESQDKQPIVSKYTNRIKRIYSGRFATSSESLNKEQRSLLLILPNLKYEDSQDYIIGFRDLTGLILLVGDTHNLKELLVPPNDYGEGYAGGRFLFSRLADGLLYPISLSTRRLSVEYLSKNQDSEIVKEIKSLLETIVKNSDETKVLEAKRKLETILVMQSNPNSIWVKMKGKNKIISYKSIGAQTSNIISGANNNEIVDKLFDTIVNNEYLFQIHKNATVEHINKLVLSGCLITDSISIHNFNGNFHVHGVDSNGDIINPLEDVQTWGDIYKPKTVNITSKKSIFILMPAEDSYTEFHYDESKPVGQRWSIGKSLFHLDPDRLIELDNYYRVALELESRNVDFIVDASNSFAVKRGRTPNSYIIITDHNEIDELNRKKKKEEENKENKNKDKNKEKEEKEKEPEVKPKDDNVGEINNDGFDSNKPRTRTRRRSRKDANLDSPMTEEQKRNAANLQHCK